MGKPSARSEACRVVVKARPTAARNEEALGDTIKVFDKCQINLQRPQPFEADRVYLPFNGDDVYEDEVKGLVSSLFQGINATVFAYGATASGKTYTVLGNPQQKGIVDRVTEDLFERFDPRTCKLSVMVEELYCETFTDLLAAPDSPRRPGTAPFPSKTPSTPRQPGVGTKYKAKESEVDSRDKLDELLHMSLQKRRTANTLLNERSSRSHVVITLTLTQHIPVAYRAGSKGPTAASSGSSSPISRSSSVDCPGAREGASDSGSELQAPTSVTTYLIGKLYLVDLAGSENIKRSGAEGRQQKEAGDINKSLCHLKTVIEEIFRGNKVPTYRNSKLTFRLQDALGGGNSKLLVIACISTAKSNLAETKETLRFAEMARSIENKPVVNTQPKDALIKSLEYEIEMLKDQLQQASKGTTVPTEVYQQLSTLEAAYAKLQEDKDMLEQSTAAQQAAAAALEISLRQQLDQASSEFGAFKSAVATCEQRLQQQLVTAEVNAAGQLTAARASAHALQQQLDAQQVAALRQQQEDSWRIEELQQQLETQQADMQQQIDQLVDAVAETTSALQTANAQLAESDGNCACLQEQLQAQQAETDAVRNTCREQQQLVEQLEQQVAQQTAAVQDLKQHSHDQQQQALQLQQQLQIEQQSKQNALGALVSTHTSMQQVFMLFDELQGQLTAQQQRHSMAAATSNNCMNSAEDLHRQLSVDRANAELLKASLIQQEQHYTVQFAAAAQQAQQVTAQHQQQQQQWQREIRIATSSIDQLQQQVTAAAAAHAVEVGQLQQQAKDLVRENSVEVIVLQQQMQAAAAAHAGTVAELHIQADAATQAHAATVADLQRQAAERAAAHAVELNLLRQQAAAAAAEHTAVVAELQQQAVVAAEAHSAEVASVRQQHQQELDRIQQQSMQKANTEKLRCKEHLALQVHNLMADAQSLSEALAADPKVVVPAETPLATPLGSPTGAIRDPTRSVVMAGKGREAGVVPPPSRSQQQQQQQHMIAVDPVDAGSSNSTSRYYAGNTEQQGIESESDASSSSSSSTADASASKSNESDEEDCTGSEIEAADADTVDPHAPSDHAQDSQSGAVYAGDQQLESASSSDLDCESSCSLADTYLRQHQHPNIQYTHHPHNLEQQEQQQEQQQDTAVMQQTPASGMTPVLQSAAILASPLPAVSPAIAIAAAAAEFKAPGAATAAGGLTSHPGVASSSAAAAAAAAAESGVVTFEWPTQYQPKELADDSVAASVFQQLTGESLTVKGLKKLLRGQELGGQRHSTSMRLGEGAYTQEKRKHELIQDFMAWYNHQVAAAAAATPAAVGSSRSSPVSVSGASSPVILITPGPRWGDTQTTPSAGTAADLAAAAAVKAPGSPAAECNTPQPQWPGSSCSGGIEAVDLCTPDTSKAAAVMAAAAANSPIELSPTSSGSSIWGWFTPKGSAKKSKSRTSAAAAAGQIKQEQPATSSRVQSHNAQKRPVSTAGGGDDGRILSKQQQQRRGSLAVAATAGPAAVAESVVANPHSSSTGAAGGESSSSVLVMFLQNHCSPDSKAPAGAAHRPLISMDRLLAARRTNNSRDTTSGACGRGGTSGAVLERRAREVRICSRRR